MEASPVLQGQRTPTPPREAFYSKTITSTHLRQISDCKRTVEMSTTRKTRNPLPRRVPTHLSPSPKKGRPPHLPLPPVKPRGRCPYTQTMILQAPQALAPGLARTADLHLQGTAFMALPLSRKRGRTSVTFLTVSTFQSIHLYYCKKNCILTQENNCPYPIFMISLHGCIFTNKDKLYKIE